MTRKKDLKKIASFVGNAAAHIALYKNFPYTMREAILYFGEAQKLAEVKSWNEADIEYVMEKAIRKAKKVIMSRSLEDKRFQELIDIAQEKIKRFIQEEMKE